eukprot:CAMPEP_0204323558 /NCGR_PEP_ID=MMETSP0469-20131031/9500_1 /ASSEMBLY_ACC=CAM_ASM_000384 /TAXON_ID=2969 /ORGANISM="Oxyrrhis marina" /LENGTH=101 /DNA_ID=CAMNT_0051305045 /DNA_START=151 /DNA_END=452 /DNA_ORIENTATION=-
MSRDTGLASSSRYRRFAFATARVGRRFQGNYGMPPCCGVAFMAWRGVVIVAVGRGLEQRVEPQGARRAARAWGVAFGSASPAQGVARVRCGGQPRRNVLAG